MLLILSVECPACCCRSCHTLVGQNEYRGAEGGNGEIPMSGKVVLETHGAQGGARGELGGVALWDDGTVIPDADRPSGLVGGWARFIV